MVRKRRKFEKSRRKSIRVSEAIIAAEPKHNNQQQFQMLRIQLNTRKKTSGHFHDRTQRVVYFFRSHCWRFQFSLLSSVSFFGVEVMQCVQCCLRCVTDETVWCWAKHRNVINTTCSNMLRSLSPHSTLQRSIVRNLWTFFLFHPQCVVSRWNRRLDFVESQSWRRKKNH